jgi:hypothetical protein
MTGADRVGIPLLVVAGRAGDQVDGPVAVDVTRSEHLAEVLGEQGRARDRLRARPVEAGGRAAEHDDLARLEPGGRAGHRRERGTDREVRPAVAGQVAGHECRPEAAQPLVAKHGLAGPQPRRAPVVDVDGPHARVHGGVGAVLVGRSDSEVGVAVPVEVRARQGRPEPRIGPPLALSVDLPRRDGGLLDPVPPSPQHDHGTDVRHPLGVRIIEAVPVRDTDGEVDATVPVEVEGLHGARRLGR